MSTKTHDVLTANATERSSYRVALDRLRESCPQIAERIDYIAALGHDWDGYGARVISPTAIDKCVRLLNTIDRSLYSQAGDLFVAPMADGGLELEWKLVFSKELALLIPPDAKVVQYLLTSSDRNGETGAREGILSEEAEIIDLLSSVLA